MATSVADSSHDNRLAPVGLIAGRGTTREQTIALEYRIREILFEHHPQTVRQVFYQCLDSTRVAHVEKSDSGYRKVQRVILDMRRTGRVPWSWIIDSSRRAQTWDNGYNDLASFVDEMRGRFRLEFWEPYIGKHVEIWCESRGFEGSIESRAGDWRCTTVAFGGQPSDSLLYDCAMRIQNRNRPTWVIYCGDLDPHGMLIEDVPRRKLREQWDCEPEWTRLLVTPDQIDSYNLPTDETGKIVQAEAFPLPEVFKLIDDAFSTIADYGDIANLEKEEGRLYDRLISAANDADDAAEADEDYTDEQREAAKAILMRGLWGQPETPDDEDVDEDDT
ncbi:MAG: hypothetical protein OXD40_09515 [bacterium]|nr:hypothetical protein [bacterium]